MRHEVCVRMRENQMDTRRERKQREKNSGCLIENRGGIERKREREERSFGAAGRVLFSLTDLCRNTCTPLLVHRGPAKHCSTPLPLHGTTPDIPAPTHKSPSCIFTKWFTDTHKHRHTFFENTHKHIQTLCNVVEISCI